MQRRVACDAAALLRPKVLLQGFTRAGADVDHEEHFCALIAFTLPSACRALHRQAVPLHPRMQQCCLW